MMAALGSIENRLYRVQQTTNCSDGHVKEVNWVTFSM
jgi:hypothetical protein